MANIKDIARETGLSVATVSRYLNGHPYVSREARYAIELTIRELGYRPNSSARSLRSGRTGRIVVVVCDVSHPFYSTLVAGAGAVATEFGYDLLIQQTCAAHWNPDRITELTATRAVDGMLLATDLEPWPEYAPALETIPVVTCDQAMEDAGYPRVFMDHHQSTIDGLAHLQERGARKILCFHAPETDRCSSNRIRLTAYRTFAENHPEVTIVPREVPDDLVETGYTIGLTLHREHPQVDAVFTGSDDLAAGILLAAREINRAVPGELKVLGFDDQPLAGVMGISTIRQPVKKMGRRAMRLLHALIQRPRHTKEEAIHIPHALVVRETT